MKLRLAFLTLFLALLLVLQAGGAPGLVDAAPFEGVRLAPATVHVDTSGDSDTPTSASRGELAPDSPPSINVWYGTQQSFGTLGVPQQWVNVLGRVVDPDGLSSLTYSLNGGPAQNLAFEPFDTSNLGGKRLAGAGDFNIEIDHADLRKGTNQVKITAKDKNNNTSVKKVTVNWSGGNVWPNPYSIDWSTVSSDDDIHSVSQIVDGLWEVKNDLLHTKEMGYDRLVAIGDMTWQEYEVEVPVTIHKFGSSKDSGVGILVRWNGHYLQNTDPGVEQPRYGHPLGALAWYHSSSSFPKHRLEILGEKPAGGGGDFKIIDDDRSHVDFWQAGDTYILKFRAEITPEGKSYYEFKAWEDGTSEPAAWTLEGPGVDRYERELHGSLLLVAHHVEASFGTVEITPLGDVYSLSVTIDGQGTVTKEPNKAVYAPGEQVTLTPVTAPDWVFSDWSGADAGDLTDNGDGTWSLTMSKNRSLGAEFTEAEYDLKVNTVGEGTVLLLPSQPPYEPDAEVVLLPVASEGWHFDGWTGPDAADLTAGEQGTWSIIMDEDKEVTANFVVYRSFLPLVVGGH